MKKQFAFILSLCLIIACVSAFAEDTPETHISGDFEYVLTEDGTAEIYKYTGSEETVTIPAELDGIPVISIGKEAFLACESMTGVIIPDTITRIGSNAFSECRGLKEVAIPDSVAEIGDHAFSDCSELVHAVLPSGLKRLEDYTFSRTNLEDLVIPDTVEYIGHNSISFCSMTSIAIPDSVTAIGDSIFKCCKQLKEIVVSPDHIYFKFENGALINKVTRRLIWHTHSDEPFEYVVPDGIQIISDSAFYSSKNLTGITIPASVSIIKGSAFYKCEHLQEVILPEGLEIIESNAFMNCSSLTSVVIPASVKDMRKNVFKNCENLTITVEADSYAEQYCKDNELKYVIAEN